jgi:uncharacterized protein YqgV (UPF0045/DUF77 family)
MLKTTAWVIQRRSLPRTRAPERSFNSIGAGHECVPAALRAHALCSIVPPIMDIGVEISLYPLQEQYRAPIHALIARLQAEGRLRVISNSMSTQIFGDYDQVMALLTRELRSTLSTGPQAACVIKLVGPLEP